jgi:hypothetical protein
VDRAAVHEDDAVGDIVGEAELVRDDHHGHAFVDQLAHGQQHLAHQLRIERRGGLVEEHHGGLHRQRPRDGHALLLAAGELARILLRLLQDPDLVELGLRDAPRVGLGHPPKLHRTDHDVPLDRHVRKEVEGLKHHPDPHPQRAELAVAVADTAIAPLGADRPALDVDAAAIGHFQEVDAAE